MVLNWCLNNYVSWRLPDSSNILVNLDNVFWMVSILFLITNSPSLLYKLLVSLTSVRFTEGHIQFSGNIDKDFAVFSFSFIFTQWFSGIPIFAWQQIILLLRINTRYCFLIRKCWSVCSSNYQTIWWVSLFCIISNYKLLCIIHTRLSKQYFTGDNKSPLVSSRYPSQYQQCFSLDDFNSSSDIQLF